MDWFSDSRQLIKKKIESLEFITIDNKQTVNKEILKLLVEKYEKNGYVIFEFLDPITSDGELLEFYRQLGLKEPYVPAIYDSQEGIYENSGLNYIESNHKRRLETSHRAFQTNNAQNLHCDGTIEKIGKIKTSTLYCQSAAESGGESIIFQSTLAFKELFQNDPTTFKSMYNPKSLKRTDIGRSNKSYIGPVFQEIESEIHSRFSIDNTSDWEYGFQQVKNLRYCFNELVKLITIESPYYYEFSLKENQGLIMANDKISHGRKSFIDSDKNMRRMIRGLYLNRPEIK